MNRAVTGEEYAQISHEINLDRPDGIYFSFGTSFPYIDKDGSVNTYNPISKNQIPLEARGFVEFYVIGKSAKEAERNMHELMKRLNIN